MFGLAKPPPAVLLRLQCMRLPGELVKTDGWAPPAEFVSVSLGRSWRICIFCELLGDGDAAGSVTTLCHSVLS